MPETAYVATAAVLLAAWAWVTRVAGPNAGLGAGVLLASLAPTWLQTRVMGQPVDCQTLVAGVGLLWLCVDRRGRIRSPLVVLDGLIAAMVVWQFLSDSRAEGASATLAVRSYGEWAFPYLAGRLALRSPVGTAAVTPWGAGTLVAVSLLTAVELLAGVNPFDAVYGPPAELDFPRDVVRFGLKRAMGPTEHPIFLGSMLLLLMPWAVALWNTRGRRRWAAIAIACGLAGICATLSRGPVLATGVAAVSLAAVKWRRLRWPAAIAAALLVAVVAVIPTRVALTLSRFGDQDRQRTDVEIGDRRYEISGSLQRVQLVRAWWPAVVEAGPLGFGTARTKGFPPMVPGRPEDARTLDLLRYIDNAYMLVAMRLGWVGAGLSLGIFVTAAVSAFRLVEDRSMLGLPAALGAVMVAIVPLLTTVHLNYEFGFELIAACGFTGALASSARAARTGRLMT